MLDIAGVSPQGCRLVAISCSFPVPCENGSVETTVAEEGHNPVAGLWGRTLGES